MIKGNISFLDGTSTLGFTAGVGEELKGAREIANLEKQGFIFDAALTVTYKAWLAGKRQGDITGDSKFEDWVENVAEVVVIPSERDIEFSIASGKMTREEADAYAQLVKASEQGEAVAPPAS